jgi:hypothetical protein
MFVHVSDIGLPWWMAIIALPFVAPGWVLLAAGLSLVLAMVVGRRRNLSSGHLVAVCASATVVGAIALPIAGFFAVDGGGGGGGGGAFLVIIYYLACCIIF